MLQPQPLFSPYLFTTLLSSQLIPLPPLSYVSQLFWLSPASFPQPPLFSTHRSSYPIRFSPFDSTPLLFSASHFLPFSLLQLRLLFLPWLFISILILAFFLYLFLICLIFDGFGNLFQFLSIFDLFTLHGFIYFFFFLFHLFLHRFILHLSNTLFLAARFHIELFLFLIFRVLATLRISLQDLELCPYWQSLLNLVFMRFFNKISAT